jgi:hypothetical protein
MPGLGHAWLSWRSRHLGHEPPSDPPEATDRAAPLAVGSVVRPSLDTGHLAQPLCGGTTLDRVLGLWSVVAALLLAFALAPF